MDAFNARYGNNSTCISFSTQDTVINSGIEISGLIILAACLLSGKLLIPSATLLNVYIDFFFKKGIRLKLVLVPFSNFPRRGGQTPESYRKFGFTLVGFF